LFRSTYDNGKFTVVAIAFRIKYMRCYSKNNIFW